MNNNEFIENLLNEISIKKSLSISVIIRRYGNPDNNESILFCENILRQLVNKNIIETSNRIDYRLMPLGEEIVENYGGWIKYNKQQEDKEKRIERKAEVDLLLAEWQVKTYKWLFLLAIIGGISGIVSLLMQLLK